MSAKRCLLVVTGCLGIAVAGLASEKTPGLDRRIDAYVQPFLADGHLSGTLLVARAGQVLYEKSFGMANYELGVPNTPETRFCVASITKPMTVALAAQLRDQGKLDAADKLSKWIPDFPRGDAIDVGQLLNHRAGIPHRVTTDRDETVPLDAADMVRLAAAAELLFEPGTGSTYSSTGYAILARVLELASGLSYGELIQRNVFAPVGMTHSAHADQRQLLAGRASSYLPRADGLINAPLKDLSFLVGAGSVYSTPHDLHLLIQAIVSGRLGEAVKRALLRPTGLSWNGITNGFRAFAEYDSTDEVEVIFAGNLQTGAADLLRRDVPRIVKGEEVATPARLAIKPVELPVNTLERYTGTYETRPGSTIELTVEDGQLWASGWLLIPTSETTFFSPQDYAEVAVVFDAQGAVERLDWAPPGNNWPCPKLK